MQLDRRNVPSHNSASFISICVCDLEIVLINVKPTAYLALSLRQLKCTGALNSFFLISTLTGQK